MPRSIACDYCGADIEPGTGTMFVRVNGQTVHFCSSKCEKNADLGREARDLEWTAAGRDARDRAAGGDDVAAAAGTDARDTDIEDQGQDVDAVDDAEADLEEIEPDDDVDPDDGRAEDDAETESDDGEEETEEAQA